MNWIAERTLSFFIDNFPSWKMILIGGPIGILWSWLCLSFAGFCKLKKGYRTGYTRKIFHFLTFMSAATIHLVWGTPAVCLFGAMCSLVIFYGIWKGPHHPLYEAMAREKDEPHRTFYIVVPYVATLVGGLASNILFNDMAVVGYLVTGLGDALGEPVGVRFGKHTYRVPSLNSVSSIRSWEGSLAVFAASGAAFALALALFPDTSLTGESLLLILSIGLVSAVIEALSPHGLDNAFLQIIPSFLAWLALS